MVNKDEYTGPGASRGPSEITDLAYIVIQSETTPTAEGKIMRSAESVRFHCAALESTDL